MVSGASAIKIIFLNTGKSCELAIAVLGLKETVSQGL